MIKRLREMIELARNELVSVGDLIVDDGDIDPAQLARLIDGLDRVIGATSAIFRDTARAYATEVAERGDFTELLHHPHGA